MAIGNNIDTITVSQKEGKKKITELAVLDENDRSSIYHLIFADAEEKVREKE